MKAGDIFFIPRGTSFYFGADRLSECAIRFSGKIKLVEQSESQYSGLIWWCHPVGCPGVQFKMNEKDMRTFLRTKP
jgi:hypothetical protein